VLTDVTTDMVITKEESFGPVAPLYRFKTEPEAIKMANDAPTLPSPASGGGKGGGVVGHLDRVRLALEAVERGNVTKGLLFGDDHVGRHIGQHGRLEEAAAPPLC